MGVPPGCTHRATVAGVTLPYTQPQRPVSGFAIATLVLGIMGIVLPAVICGIVALGQIRGGIYSGRGMVMAGLLVSAVWSSRWRRSRRVCQSPGRLSPRHEFADIVAPWSSRAVWPAVIRTVRPTGPPVSGVPRPSALRPSVHTSQSPSWAAMRVKLGQRAGRVGIVRGPHADICGRRRGNHHGHTVSLECVSRPLDRRSLT